MGKRNIIHEIKEKNVRSSEKYLHGNKELYDLEAFFRRLDNKDETGLSLLMVGIPLVLNNLTERKMRLV